MTADTPDGNGWLASVADRAYGCAMRGLLVVLAGAQTILVLGIVVPSLLGGWLFAPQAGAYVGLPLLFLGLPAVTLWTSAARQRGGGEQRVLQQGFLAAALVVSVAAFFYLGTIPTPWPGYRGPPSGTITNGEAFGLTTGMNRVAAERALGSSGRFYLTWNDPRLGGGQQIWEADPYWFGEARIVELTFANGSLVSIRWQGGGNVIG